MCDAEMILIKAVPDESVGVTGFESHTLQCSNCGDVEERLVFSTKPGGRTADVVPPEAPSVSPSSSASPAPMPETEAQDNSGFWERAFTRMVKARLKHE
jgi:hypothetical protein